MADIFDRCVNFRQEQRIAKAEDLPVVDRVLFDTLPIANAGPWFQMNGSRFLQFSTNDYLGMSIHPEVCATAAEYARLYGISAPMGARALTGTCELHLELERRIAEFKGTETAITFATGANAMMGAVAALTRPGDLILLDQLAHASLVCGAKISGGTMKFFRHNDAAHLERLLRQADPGRPKLVVIDGVYSMSGDVAPLVEICDVCRPHGARILLDDAHGNGVLGPTGRGTAEHFRVHDRIDIHAGTFSKAFGTSGGFVAAARPVVFYIRSLAPTLLFTKAPSACVTAATIKSLELVVEAGDRRERLWRNARLLQESLRSRGFNIGATTTPITPILLGGNKALFAADILRRKHNIFISAVLYPAVRRGSAILRAVPTALHRAEDVAALVEALAEAVREIPKERAAAHEGTEAWPSR